MTHHGGEKVEQNSGFDGITGAAHHGKIDF